MASPVCDLCTVHDERPLVNPGKTGCTSRTVSFKNLSDTLLDLKKDDCLPKNFNMALFELGEYDSFEDKLQKMNIQYHKACRNNFNGEKLIKLKSQKKKRSSETNNYCVSPIKKLRQSEVKHTSKSINQNEKLMSTVTPKTKRSRGRPKKTKKEEIIPQGLASKPCAICFKAVDLQSDDCRNCRTDSVSANIGIWARSLNKHDISANLIVKSNDLHAANAVYHFNCYTELKNEYNALINERSKQSARQVENAENSKRKEAFDAVCNHVQEMKSSGKTVFILKDLFSMYVSQLTEWGILSETTPNGEPNCAEDDDLDQEKFQDDYSEQDEDNTETFHMLISKIKPAYRKVNKTRFKSSPLQSFPNLKESVRNNQVYLIFEEDLGETLHSTSLHESLNYESDEEILSRNCTLNVALGRASGKCKR